MKKYDKYKPSGVEWIGDIPEHWELKKLTYGFKKIGSGTTPTSGNEEYYNGTINWLQTGDLKDGEINFTSKKITKKALKDFSTLREYPIGSLVIAMYGATIGKVGLLNITTTTNQACCVISEPITYHTKFVFWWLVGNKDFVVSKSYGGGQPNISQELIKSFRLPCPPESEQTAIANYLDQKTAQIDTLIANKQRLIELFKEERKAIINQAVTRGINPNVKLKSSGIEWLGDIPKHWDCLKIKRRAIKITDGEHISPAFLTEGIPFLSAKDVRDREISFDVDKFVSIEDATKLRKRCGPEKGDLLIVSRGATIGRIGLIETEKKFCLLGSVILIKPNKEKISPVYLYYLLTSDMLQNQFLLLSASSAQQAIYIINVQEQFILLPSLEEQWEIEEYLEAESNRTKTAIEKINKEIELLQEYRTALISEVVTGKIKVI